MSDGDIRTEDMRCGFAALVGAPNAGKSTLLNQLVGAKVSIVSRKAQTTRALVRGIIIEGAAQIILVLSLIHISAQFSRTFTKRKRCTFCSAASAISLRAAWPMALMVRPPSPITIFFCPSRATKIVCSMRAERCV